jgi:hypothetical protein
MVSPKLLFGDFAITIAKAGVRGNRRAAIDKISPFGNAAKPLTLALSPSEGEKESAAEMSSISFPHPY